MSCQPSSLSNSVTCAFALVSFPERNTVWSPLPTNLGFTISAAVMVLRVLTTRKFGNARCRISPSESVSFTNKVSGKPRLISIGLEMSIRVLPFRCSSPTVRSTSRLAAPLSALMTSSPWVAASRKVPTLSPVAVSPSQSRKVRALGPRPFGSSRLEGSRVPSITECPSWTNLRRKLLWSNCLATWMSDSYPSRIMFG